MPNDESKDDFQIGSINKRHFYFVHQNPTRLS
jgi:hypothetical protein